MSPAAEHQERPVIVLVDDQPVMRQALREFITAVLPGATILERSDPPGTLGFCIKALPDLILMDVDMPSGNGIELTKSIKASLPEVRIVMVTTYGGGAIRKLALEAGADDFIAKDRVFTEVPPILRALRSIDGHADATCSQESLSPPSPILATQPASAKVSRVQLR